MREFLLTRVSAVRVSSERVSVHDCVCSVNILSRRYICERLLCRACLPSECFLALLTCVTQYTFLAIVMPSIYLYPHTGLGDFERNEEENCAKMAQETLHSSSCL